MDEERIEKHHLIFYISTIGVIFLLEYFTFEMGLSELKLTLIGFIIYTLLLMVFSNLLLFVLYGYSAIKLLGFNYRPRNPIYYRDILLTSSAIISTFLIDDLFNIVNLVTEEYSFILTIILIPFFYLGIHKINEQILPRIFS